MGTHASSRGLAFPVCSRSPPHLSFSSPSSNSKAATTMSSGGGRVGGGSYCKKPPPPPGAHPRYIPKRGAVLKGIVRSMLGCFLLISPLISAPVNSGGRRVRPAPPGAAEGDGAEQGK